MEQKISIKSRQGDTVEDCGSGITELYYEYIPSASGDLYGLGEDDE